MEPARARRTHGRGRPGGPRWLAEITDSINRAATPDAVAHLLAADSASLCGTGMASVFLLSDDGEYESGMVVGLPHDFAHDLEKYARTRWATHQLVAPSGPSTITLSGRGPFPSPIHKLAAAAGMAQILSVPLSHGDRLVGVLLLYSKSEQSFAPAAIDQIAALANIAALAIVHARALAARDWERKSQDQFLDVLSHELRTPLTSIMGFTQMIRRRYGLQREQDARTRDQLELLWAQVQRLHRLLDTFVDMSNLERGEFTIGHEQVDLATVLSVALEQAEAQSRSRHRLLIEMPDKPIWVQGDMRRLEHAFIHVITNAMRYSPAEAPIKIVCSEPGPNEVTVSVIDQGPGIPLELRREIFKRFYPSDARKTGGMGMGLYFSRAIVEAHGGRLTIESSPNHGTTVHINLPLH